VLRPGLEDVAVVVSDNSTDGGERGRLEEFCAGVAGRAVTYVRPPEPLPMAEHWEWLWQTIRTTAPAPHVAYLTDRLVFGAGSLAALLDAVDRHPEKVVSYHWDHVADAAEPVELVQRPWTGRLYELASSRLIELASRGEFGDYVPRLMNSIAPTAVVEEIERRFGDVFGSIAPDYRFAYRCLAVCETILYLDRACVIEHGLKRSAGINFQRGRMNADAARFASEVTDDRFAATPEPGFVTNANAIFQEYCAVRAELGGVGFPPPDRRSYLTANAVSVARIEDPEWHRRMHELLRRHGWRRRHAASRAVGVGLRIATYLARHPGALARAVRRQLWERPPGSPAASLLARAGLNPRTRDELRFATAGEAIAHANAHPRPPTPHAFHVDGLRRAGAIVARRR
jgi:hypothetical protein